MRRPLLVAALALVLTPILTWAQESENLGPQPMLWAVPHLQLDTESGKARLLHGLDASLALPLAPRTHVTATYRWNFAEDNVFSAMLNYDYLLTGDAVLRGSVGLFDDEFGFGLTCHRWRRSYGVGAFANSVDGDFFGGLLFTKPVSWGVKLGRGPLPQRSESRDWSSGAGLIGDLGACAALEVSRGSDRGEIGTTTAYFPRQRTSWVREGGSAQSSSVTGQSFLPPLKAAWAVPTEGAIRTSAAIVNRTVYVGSQDGWLYALEAGTGQRLWRFPAEAAISGAPAVTDRHVFVGTEAGDVYCVAPPEKGGAPAGRLVWKYRAGGAVTGSPLVTEAGLVVFGAADTYVYGLDQRTGKLIWRLATGGPVLASASKVGRRIPAAVDAAGQATARSGGVLIPSSDGKLYAVDEVRGQVIWTFATDGPITAAPVLSGDRVYLANRVGSVYALHAPSGRQLWAVKGGGSVAEAPAVDEKRVYVAAAEGALWALDRETGKTLWQTEAPAAIVSSPTVVRGDLLYLAARDGGLYVHDAVTGQQVWALQERESWSTAPAIADGLMVLGGEEGRVYAFLPGPGLPKAAPPRKPVDTKTQPGGKKPENPTGAARPLPTRTATRPTPPKSVTPVTPVETPAPPAPVAAVPPKVELPPIPVEVTLTAPLPPTGARPASVVYRPPTTRPPVSVSLPTPPEKPIPPVTTEPPTPPVTPEKPPPPPPAERPVTTPPPAEKPTPPLPAEKPVTPTPPVKPTPPADFPRPTLPPAEKPVPSPSVPAPAASSPGVAALLTLLITPADGRIPTLLCNQNTLFVGGKIGVGSDIARVRVNGIETPIRNGEYGTQVAFPGPGSYEIVVEAEDRQGQRTAHRRHVWVLAGRDAQASEVLEFGQRGGSFIATFVPGVRNVPLASLRKVIELRNAQDQLVRTWSMAAEVTEAIAWNGADAAGRPLKPGRYAVTYLLVESSGAIQASIVQPLELRD